MEKSKTTSMVATIARRCNPERREARRRQVLDAAADCFRRSGFRGASMADISAAARMSPGLIYHYFKSKEAIVKAIVERDRDCLLSYLEQLKGQPNILRALLDGVEETPCGRKKPLVSALLVEIFAEASRDAEVATILRQRSAALRSGICQALRIGQRQGVIVDGADVEGMAVLLDALVHGLTMLAVLDPNRPGSAGPLLAMLLTAILCGADDDVVH